MREVSHIGLASTAVFWTLVNDYFVALFAYAYKFARFFLASSCDKKGYISLY